jgi:hypothetical protein
LHPKTNYIPEYEKSVYLTMLFICGHDGRGEGAKPNLRVLWSHQLTDISHYDMKIILAGSDGWEPQDTILYH